MKPALPLAAFACLLGSLPAQSTDEIFRAIRANELSTLRSLPAAAVNAKDRLDTTPLHYAALYGNAESVRILLDRGADVKARNKSDATPLIYGAYSFEKARLLVDKGSDVNAKSASGMTPLLIAVSVHGNAATVRYLIEKGADVKVEGPNGADALQTAALKGDLETIRLLLQRGADPKRADQAGFTALLNAFSFTDAERARILIDAGSDVNATNKFAGMVKNGPIDLVHMSPMFLAASDAEPHTIQALLKSGASVNETDQRKMNCLMTAVSTDQPKLATIRELIAARVDVNAKDRNGESVLDWAMKYRNPEVIAILKAAGATSSVPFTAPKRPSTFDAGTPKDAIARSSALLAKSGEVFFVEGGGCVGCHHQPLNARAFAALRDSSHQPDPRLRTEFLDGMVALRPFALSNLPLQTARGGDFDEFLSEMQALADLGEPASATTDAIVFYLASRQQPSGEWYIAGLSRPPLEASAISRTAAGVRALKVYGWPARKAEFDEQIARARAWLLASKPVTSYEQADRIAGLRTAGVPPRDLEKPAQALLKEQRPDGGWAQTPYLDSDAFATGFVLSTLRKEGFLKASDPAYTRGVAFLLKTQFPDGSWYVRSRSPKIQPYFQSAFPFNHDQWISNSGTAMAVMALAPAQ